MKYTKAAVMLPVGVVVRVNGLRRRADDTISEFFNFFNQSALKQSTTVESNTSIEIVLDVPNATTKETARLLRELANEIESE